LNWSLGGAGAFVRLTHAGFPDDESRKQHDDAWRKVLAQLDERMRVPASTAW
jgi:hypothetical protein